MFIANPEITPMLEAIGWESTKQEGMDNFSNRGSRS
jgi:hypothetical protein